MTSKSEAAQLPGVPPIAKTVPGFENTGWFGIVAPAGTPKEIVQKVYRDTRRRARGERSARAALRPGARPVGNTPEQMAKEMKEESALWARVVKERNIQVMKVDLAQVEEAAKELYIRALKALPPDIKRGFEALASAETDAGAKRMLGTMIRNIAVAEQTDNLLCQDTGIPVYNVWIGRGVEVDGVGLKDAIRRGCARSTREYSFRPRSCTRPRG